MIKKVADMINHYCPPTWGTSENTVQNKVLNIPNITVPSNQVCQAVQQACLYSVTLRRCPLILTAYSCFQCKLEEDAESDDDEHTAVDGLISKRHCYDWMIKRGQTGFNQCGLARVIRCVRHSFVANTWNSPLYFECFGRVLNLRGKKIDVNCFTSRCAAPTTTSTFHSTS